MAVEAVISEPVSAGVFPVKRENTGKFRRSSLKNAIGLGFRACKSEGYGQIPYASEQGKFSELAGNLTRISGNEVANIALSDAMVSPSRCESRPDGIFGKDSLRNMLESVVGRTP